jgi:tetratricopeptide (TPR) repeat protein
MLDFDKAKRLLAAYTNAGRKATLEKQLLRGIAKVAETREDWKEAETRLRDLLKVAPEDLDAHKRLALSLFQRGKVKDAYDVLKAAKKIDRENANKYRTRSVFPAPEEIIAHDFDKREGPKATNEEKWHKAAIEDAPDDLATRQAATIWALENGKLAFAKEQADAALRIESSDAKKYSGSNVGRTLRGVVALWEKDWSTAENYFQKIIDASPTDFVARNIMALALVEQDDPQKKQLAQAYADANYKDNNQSPDALSTLGWVYFRRGEFDQAKLALGEAVKATGGNLNNADTATYLAHILYQQDQKWQTKELLDNILKGDRPFSMRHEAEKLYEKVKDEKRPESAPATKTP